MAKTKKRFNGSYGYVGWVEKLGRNVEFASEREYLEFIEDDERIENMKWLIETALDSGVNVENVGIF